MFSVPIENQSSFQSLLARREQTMANNKPKPSAARRIKRWAIAIIVLTSVVWTAVRWDSLAEVKEKVGQVAIFGGLMLINEVFFTSGLIMIAGSLGRHIFAGAGANPINWVRALWGIRAKTTELLHSIADSRMFRVGFTLNWIGAVGTGLIPTVGIVVLLPYTAWGIAVLPLIDVVASIGIRAPIQAKINQTRQEVAP